MAQVNRSPKTYDVCIIVPAQRSMAAKILTEGGMDVVLLEAGRRFIRKKTTRC